MRGETQSAKKDMQKEGKTSGEKSKIQLGREERYREKGDSGRESEETMGDC